MYGTSNDHSYNNQNNNERDYIDQMARFSTFAKNAISVLLQNTVTMYPIYSFFQTGAVNKLILATKGSKRIRSHSKKGEYGHLQIRIKGIQLIFHDPFKQGKILF